MKSKEEWGNSNHFFLFFIFSDYNLIATVPFSFHSPNPHIYIPWNPWPFYCLPIVIGCMYGYAHTCLFIHIAHSVWIMNAALFMISELTDSQWTIYWCTLLWGKSPLPFPALHRFLYSCEELRLEGLPHSILHVQSCLAHMLTSCWWAPVDVSSGITRRPSLTANFLLFWLLKPYYLLLHNIHWHRCRSVLCLCPLGLGSPILYLYWLLFSVVVSICCKEKFHW